MAKDKSEAELREKKEKKDKKRKREEAAAEDAAPAKKEKKDKKRKSDADALDGDVVMTTADDVTEVEVNKTVAKAALVPFAEPLADDKAEKKVLKSVKKAAKSKALKRGVKECVKAIRKSSPGDPASLTSSNKTPSGIVVLAADISPMDVISHIPVLCEDHNIPYIFVRSRAELGAAGSTKRPTSVVLVSSQVGKGAEKDAEGEWPETYKDLHKLSLKLAQIAEA